MLNYIDIPPDQADTRIVLCWDLRTLSHVGEISNDVIAIRTLLQIAEHNYRFQGRSIEGSWLNNLWIGYDLFVANILAVRIPANVRVWI